MILSPSALIVAADSAADENFGDTLSLYSGSSSNGLTTSDKGKTWHTDAIKISKDTFATVSDY